MEIMNIDRKCRARSRCSFYDVRPRCRSNSFSTLDHLTKLPSVMDWARNSFSLGIPKSCNIFRKKKKQHPVVVLVEGVDRSSQRWSGAVSQRFTLHMSHRLFDQVLDPPLENHLCTLFIIQHWNCNTVNPRGLRPRSSVTRDAEFFFFSLFIRTKLFGLTDFNNMEKSPVSHGIICIHVSILWRDRKTWIKFDTCTFSLSNLVVSLHAAKKTRRVNSRGFSRGLFLKAQGCMKSANISILFYLSMWTGCWVSASSCERRDAALRSQARPTIVIDQQLGAKACWLYIICVYCVYLLKCKSL